MIDDKNPLSDKAQEFLKLVRNYDGTLVSKYRGLIKNRGLLTAVKAFKEYTDKIKFDVDNKIKQQKRDDINKDKKFIDSLQLLKAVQWYDKHNDEIQAKLLSIVNKELPAEYITAVLEFNEDFRLDPPLNRMSKHDKSLFMISPSYNPNGIITVAYTKILYSIKGPVDLNNEHYMYPFSIIFRHVIYYNENNELVLDLNNRGKNSIYGSKNHTRIIPAYVIAKQCNSLESFYNLVSEVTDIINKEVLNTVKIKSFGLRKFS